MARIRFTGSARLRLAWCLWFALLMGAPYPPLDSTNWFIGWGPTSLSKIYAWVALGVVLGIWFGSHPAVVGTVGSAKRARTVVAGLGVALSVVLVLAAWVNLALALFCVPEGETVWAAGLSSPVLSVLSSMMGPIGRCSIALSGVASFLCGWSAWSVFHAPRYGGPSCGPSCERLCGPSSGFPHGGPHSDSLQSALTAFGRVAPIVAAAFVLGAVQPLGWMLLLPHGEFPQLIARTDSISAGGFWDAASMGWNMLTTALPTVLTAVFSLGTTRAFDAAPSLPMTAGPLPGARPRWGETTEGRALALAPVAALCLGVLSFRVVSRVVPSVCRTPLWLAVAALCVYAVLFAVTVLLASRRARECRESPAAVAAPGPAAEPSLGPSCETPRPSTGSTDISAAAELGAVLTDAGRSFLSERGLTEREALAVCGHLAGLTAARTGELMGVAEPTVREYRRRARKKLDAADMDGIASMLPEGSVASREESRTVRSGDGPSESGGVDRGGARGRDRFGHACGAAALFCLVASMALVLLPPSGFAVVWDEVWATSFGIAAGLVGGLLGALAMESAVVSPTAGRGGTDGRRSLWVALAAAVTLGLFVSAVGIVVMRTWPAELVQPETFRKALALTSTALFVGCSMLILLVLAPLAVRWIPRTVTVVVLAAAMAVAVALGRLGMPVWRAAFVAACAGAVVLGSAAIMCVDSGGDGEDRVFAGKRASGAAEVGLGGGLPEGGSALLRALSDPWGLPWLFAASILAWTWGELWRAQRYESLLGMLQWFALVLLVVAAVRMFVFGELGKVGIAASLGLFTVTLAVSGLGSAVVIDGLLMFGIHVLNEREPDEGALSPFRSPGGHVWHSPTVAAAFGLVAGTLVANAFGYLELGLYYSLRVVVEWFSLAASWGVVLALTAGTVACAWALTAGRPLSLTLPDRERLKAIMRSRGLSEPQADIALLLAEGLSVSATGQLLGYSRATIALARRVAYQAFGVRSRSQFVEVLEAHLRTNPEETRL